MRFSKKQFPILEHIENDMQLFKFQERGLTEQMLNVKKEGKDVFQETYDHCGIVLHNKEIDFVSVPFFEKIMSDKIFAKLSDLFNNLEDCDGILLYPKSRFSKINAASYAVFKNENHKGVMAQIHLYHNEGRIAALYVNVKEEKINWSSIISTSIKNDSKGNEFTKEQIAQWMQNHSTTLLSVLTFKQFAEIEVTEIGGKEYPKKTKVGKEKYLNESDYQVNVLDSRWFTETIRTDGFAVRGHFRLQPCGVGLKDRKLIYIDDFLKNGYTRKARIEMSENN